MHGYPLLVHCLEKNLKYCPITGCESEVVVSIRPSLVPNNNCKKNMYTLVERMVMNSKNRKFKCSVGREFILSEIYPDPFVFKQVNIIATASIWTV